jgi:pSer/pThr/pTyr-binding forkhead associated (FHA) protein
MLKYTLSISSPEDGNGLIYELNDNYLLGRNPPVSSINTIAIINKFVSKTHCTLILMPPDDEHHFSYYVVKDGNIFTGDKSTNGTWVNGLRIAHDSEEKQDALWLTSVELRHRDIITFGSSKAPKAIFEIQGEEEQEKDATSTSPFPTEIDI